MSPNVPDLKILNLAFSHRLESSYQWATVAPFFNIKVTRYRTCISDRYGQNSIKYHCAKLWNDMFPTGRIQVDGHSRNDVHLSKINTIHYFKKVLKKHFLFQYSSAGGDFIYY